MKRREAEQQIRFGTGGWRAIIGEEFTRYNIEQLAVALAQMMHQDQTKEFVIGYDRRFLSQRAAHWLAERLANNGIKVYLIDEIAPTPLIMYAVAKWETLYGAAITASHNPAEYNGVKIFTAGGRDATQAVTDRIEAVIAQLSKNPALINQLNFEQAMAEGMIERIDPFNQYLDRILELIDVEAIKNKRLKIILDPMYGVSKTCLQTILITARCDLDIINDRHDALFGGRLPSPSAHTLRKLQALVVERKYDLGIGTDGDADRLGIIDQNGNFVHPNMILSLLYYYLLKHKGWAGGVVRNLATTHLLDKIAADYGQTCYEVPVGFKHISAAMEAQNALIGGESSGGLTIRGHIKGKDGIFAAALLVEMISKTGKGISELITEIEQQYGRHWMEERDFRLTQDQKELLQQKLFDQKQIPEYEQPIVQVSYMDGLKIYFADGWIIVRFSGTEPVLRIFAEMETAPKAVEVINTMMDFLKIR